MAAKKISYEINVYDDEGNVVKTCKSIDAKLKFGSVRKIMALLHVDDIDDTGELLRTVYGAWDQLTKVLSKCFPEMTDEDWDNVYLEELIPTLVNILKLYFGKLLGLPADSKN